MSFQTVSPSSTPWEVWQPSLANDMAAGFQVYRAMFAYSAVKSVWLKRSAARLPQVVQRCRFPQLVVDPSPFTRTPGSTDAADYGGQGRWPPGQHMDMAGLRVIQYST